MTTDTNTANTASPVVSSASYNFAAMDVGAWLFVQSGTDWTPGWYQIASVASNKATLSAAIGAALLYGTVSINANYHRPNGLTTAAGCATVGTPTGGVWGIDYSQQTGAAVTFTDMVIDATTNTFFQSVAFPVGKNYIGNIINVTSGTGFTVQRVQVVSTIGNLGTVDKSLGTLGSTGGNGKLGGAIGSSSTLTALTQALVAGNIVYIKATGTYTLTVTTTVTAGTKGNVTDGRLTVEGYTTYPGDGGKATITSATNSVALFTLNDNDYFEFKHLNMTHSAATRGYAFTLVTSASQPLRFTSCIVNGCLSFLNTGMAGVLGVELVDCEVMNTTSATAALSLSNAGAGMAYRLFGCDIHDNVGDGIRWINTGGGRLELHDTIIDTNGGVGINFTNASGSAAMELSNCIVVDNVSDGVKFAATSTSPGVFATYRNNIFYGNGGYGINNLDEQASTDLVVNVNRNNAYGSNSSGARLAFTGDPSDITLTADPFTSRAGRDFSLNSTAGGGAACRAAGFPGAFPGGTTTSYFDVGAAQHQSSGGGAVYHGAMAGGLLA